jgi:chlorophyllide a reductase subunit Z
MWRGPQSDWFAFVDYAAVASRTYVEGLRAFLRDELGMKEVWAAARPRSAEDMDNIAIRKRLHERAPAFVFGSINEKIYLAEANVRATFYLPAAFPGPVVRRTFGTPFVGYAGAAYLMQELVNRFYESVFNFLPVETLDSAERASKAQVQTMPWTQEAAELLQSAMENVPYLARISANRALRQAAEQLARAADAPEVTRDMVEQALQAEH